MKRIVMLALVACFLVVGLSGCCGGQPTMSLGMPTLSFGQNSSVPQQAVQVPMVPAYSVQAAPAYPAPAAPCAPPVRANPCP